MIVVDTNVIAYLLLGGDKTPAARSVFQRDPIWAAPLLWRSEFRSVLAMYLRRGMLTRDQAVEFMNEAEALMLGQEYEVESRHVIQLLNTSKCSAYDCEFVALAERLGASLVTSDMKILQEFPDTARSIESYGSA